MISNKTLSKKTKKYWGALPLGYFEIARLGILTISQKDNLGKLIWEDGDEHREVFIMQDAAILIASIYNLKHAIELSVKALEVSIENTYTHGHDFEIHFPKLKSKLKNYCIDELFNFYETLVLKYSKFDFGDNQTLDRNNQIFRYTETLSGESLDYLNIHKVSKDDLCEILNDINDLKIVFKLLNEQYHIFKSHYDFGLEYKEIKQNLLRVPTVANPGFKKSFFYKN